MTHFWVFLLMNWQLLKTPRSFFLSEETMLHPEFAGALWSVQYHKLWV